MSTGKQFGAFVWAAKAARPGEPQTTWDGCDGPSTHRQIAPSDVTGPKKGTSTPTNYATICGVLTEVVANAVETTEIGTP